MCFGAGHLGSRFNPPSHQLCVLQELHNILELQFPLCEMGGHGTPCQAQNAGWTCVPYDQEESHVEGPPWLLLPQTYLGPCAAGPLDRQLSLWPQLPPVAGDHSHLLEAVALIHCRCSGAE